MRIFSQLLRRVLVAMLIVTSISAALAQTASVSVGCAPLTVNFTPPAGQPSFYWVFGNGASSLEANPSVIYTQPGMYTVNFSLVEGGPVVGSTIVNVLPKPVVSFTADNTQGCRPMLVVFTNTSTVAAGVDITGYSWVFGDGNGGAGASTNHNYTGSGSYDVSLQLQSSQQGCTVTGVVEDFIVVGGVDGLNFITQPNPAITCNPPLNVNFINTTPNAGALDFSWTFGNGATSTAVNPGQQTYTSPGNYQVTLTATDSLGCQATRNRNVRVLQPAAPNVPDTLCLNARYFYEEWVDAQQVTWNFPPSAIRGTTAEGEPFVVFSTPGFVSVGLNAVNSTPILCELDTVFQLFVDRVDVSLQVTPATFTCEYELPVNYSASSATGASFQWLFHDFSSASGPNTSYTHVYGDTTTHSMNGLNEYMTILFATNPSGCRDSLIHLDTIYVPNALFMTDRIRGCAPLAVTFADSSASFAQQPILEWHYDYGDGTTATFFNDDDHVHVFSQPGEYEVTLHIVNSEGCRDTSYARYIEVGTMLDMEQSWTPGAGCTPPELTLSPLYAVIDEIVITPQIAYIFYNGCITEIPLMPPPSRLPPNVNAGYETTCEAPYTMQFSSTFRGSGVEWDFGDGNVSSQQNPVHTYAETGDYTVTATVNDPDGICPPAIAILQICIRDIKAELSVPERVCLGEQVVLDASLSRDVKPDFCAYGYTWFFEYSSRPIMGNDAELPFAFVQPGDEEVTLVVEAVNGCTDTIRQTVRVFAVNADIIPGDTLICMPAMVPFNSNIIADTTVVSYNWDFGDLSTASGSPSVSHTYNNLPEGTRIGVTLQVEDVLGCRATATDSLFVYQPVSSISSLPSPANICVGQPLEFTASQFTAGGSSLTFLWNDGQGNTQSGQTVAFDYDVPGMYPVNLQFMEIGSGCQGSSLAFVGVQDYPEAAFTSSADSLGVICNSAQVQFMDATQSPNSLNYNWDFGNGITSTLPNPIVAFDNGAYTFTLIASTNYGCADTVSRSFVVSGPSGDFSIAPGNICPGQSVTFTLLDTMQVSAFTWDFGDGTLLNNVNPAVHTYDDVSTLGPRPVVLLLTGSDGICETAVEQNLTIDGLLANFQLTPNSDTVACAGTYTLINTSVGASEYEWQLPNGTSTTAEPMVTFEPGSYTINLLARNEDGSCVDEMTQTFTFLQASPVPVLGDTICLGDTARIVSSPPQGTSVLWSPAQGLLDASNTPAPRVLVEETTTYTLNVVDAEGCTASSEATVLVITPLAWENVEQTLCPGDTINVPLPPDGLGYIYTWTPQAPPTVIGDEDLNLELQVTDLLGCYLSSYSYNLISLLDTVIVPNVFTPNGDNINDVFKVYREIPPNRTDLMQITLFKVFNRWGQLVYEGSGDDPIWNGEHNGQPAPADLYIYHIIVEVPKTDRRYDLKGNVTLLR